MKAARAVLPDHGGDVEKLKAAEPWMFADAPAKQTGKTGLPNAGAAADADRQLKQWRDIAGLNDIWNEWFGGDEMWVTIARALNLQMRWPTEEKA